MTEIEDLSLKKQMSVQTPKEKAKKPRLRKKPQLQKVSYQQNYKREPRSKNYYGNSRNEFVKKEPMYMRKKEPTKNWKLQNEKKEFTTWDTEEVVKKD